jgi:hypothetical protein
MQYGGRAAPDTTLGGPSHGRGVVMKLTKKIGVLCLSAWLIMYGLAMVLALTFQGMNVIMGILAIVAGVLLALDQ